MKQNKYQPTVKGYSPVLGMAYYDRHPSGWIKYVGATTHLPWVEIYFSQENKGAAIKDDDIIKEGNATDFYNYLSRKGSFK